MHISIPAVGATAIVACAAGAVALTYSPMPCACESPWQVVYAAAGLPYTFPYKYFSPSEVEKGLNQQLKGKIVQGSSSYFFDACKSSGERQLLCVIDTEVAGNLVRGYSIEIEVDRRGAFERAHVSAHNARR
jgi:hypothetical protein